MAEGVERKAPRFLGQEVGEAEQALIREIVGTCGGLSRMELAATVGELLGWKRRRGSLKARECREFLEKLESQGGLVLPPKRRGRPPGKATEVPVTAGGEPGARLVGTARDLGEIRLQQVRTREQRRLFRELVGRYHYLGQRVPFGAHLRYLVYASEPAARVVACVQFSSAAWRIAVRDRWIGWEAETRTRQLVHVVSNSRYLVLPWVQVKNLASRILSRAVRQLAVDWPRSYGVEVFLVETLVDPERYRRSCYRGANWIELGSTRGAKREDRLARGEAVRPKRVLVYPLVAEAARRLREG